MVTPITEVAATITAATSHYMTMKINGVLHIGVMMPVSGEGARAIERLVNGQTPSVPSRSVLYTSNVSGLARVPALRGVPQTCLGVVKAEAAQTLSWGYDQKRQQGDTTGALGHYLRVVALAQFCYRRVGGHTGEHFHHTNA